MLIRISQNEQWRSPKVQFKVANKLQLNNKLVDIMWIQKGFKQFHESMDQYPLTISSAWNDAKIAGMSMDT